MPRVRDLLYRFRPAGAPGAASAAGVPADRSADLAAELEPLFAQLLGTERECAEIREQARQDATGVRARDAERARNVVTAAGEQVEAERATVAAQMQQRADAGSATQVAAAAREAAALRDRATERMPVYVERVVDAIRELIGDTDTRPADARPERV
jgi:hypothetical protein